MRALGVSAQRGHRVVDHAELTAAVLAAVVRKHDNLHEPVTCRQGALATAAGIARSGG